MKKSKNKTVSLWINLAKSDLTSARLLYNNRHYRTSYFLFQQAVEKANKAFVLIHGLATEESFKEFKHDQFKIFRKYLVKQEADIGVLIKAIETEKEVKMTFLLKQGKLQRHQQFLNEAVRFIDGLRNKDMVNISATDLNSILREIKKNNLLKLRLPVFYNRKAKALVQEFITSVKQLNAKKAVAAIKNFEEFTQKEGQFKTTYETIVPAINVVLNALSSFYVLHICALLTIQHSSLTRYPDRGLDPTKIYTLRLPLVKKQSGFMDLLQVVLKRMVIKNS